MPHNLEAERAVIGAILLEQTYLFQASEILSTEDFYLEANRKIFGAIQSLHHAESGIDFITVKNELQKLSQLEAAGGAAYLVSLTDGLPRATNVPHYAQIVKDASVRRRVINLANEAMTRGYQEDDTNKDIIEHLQLELLKLSEAGRKRGGWIRANDLVAAAYKEIEDIAAHRIEAIGLDTGFQSLNRMTQGFKPGELVIVAGRPGHGKSSICTNIIANGILKHGWRVGLFTLEMSGREIIKREMYSEAEVDSYRAGGGFLTKLDWQRLHEAAGRLADTRLYVDESGGLTIAELRSRAQSLAIEGGIDLIVIDYLQLMSGTSSRRDGNRAIEVSEISRGLKILAKDLNVPIIACSQLNRAIESDKNRKPILADLRESGSIEQDADMVLFIWREELRSQKSEDAGKAELIIGKQRSGPTGAIDLVFLPKFTKFADATNQRELPEYN
jgi:replicative DNA helicase